MMNTLFCCVRPQDRWCPGTEGQSARLKTGLRRLLSIFSRKNKVEGKVIQVFSWLLSIASTRIRRSDNLADRIEFDSTESIDNLKFRKQIINNARSFGLPKKNCSRSNRVAYVEVCKIFDRGVSERSAKTWIITIINTYSSYELVLTFHRKLRLRTSHLGFCWWVSGYDNRR